VIPCESAIYQNRGERWGQDLTRFSPAEERVPARTGPVFPVPSLAYVTIKK
jgi:hypothetical protein